MRVKIRSEIRYADFTPWVIRIDGQILSKNGKNNNNNCVTYKHQGPPCEYLGVGACTCHEFLASPKGLSMRSTGQKKRKSGGLSRTTHRELKARKTKEAINEAYTDRKTLNALQLGRTQSINNYLRHAAKVCVAICALVSNPHACF